MNQILFFYSENSARKHSGVDAHASGCASDLFCTLSQKTIPRAWASSTPPTCAALDGRAPEQMGQPGRPLSRSRGSCAQNSVEIERECFHEGKSSWVHQKGILPRRLMKCGAMHFNMGQWIAPSQSAPLAGYGRTRPQKIGPKPRACSLARSSIGLQDTRLVRLGAWRSFASLRDNPHPAPANPGRTF
jgi:hypothetical protein